MMNAGTIGVGLSLLMQSATLPSEKSMISRWSKEYEKFNSDRQRRQKILNAIFEGYDTLDEISAETKIPYSTTRRILLDLERHRKVISERVKRRSNRPDRIFILVEA